MKRIIIIVAVFMMMSFAFGETTETTDLSNGEVDGYYIEESQPGFLPIATYNVNSMTLRGSSFADIDPDSIQMYRPEGLTPLLVIQRPMSYGNGMSFNYKFVDGFVPNHGDAYGIRFKNKNTGKWYSYRIKASHSPTFEIYDDMSESIKQAIFVRIENTNSLDSSAYKSAFYLEDNYGNELGTGSLSFPGGRASIIFDLDKKPATGQRYYVKSNDERFNVIYGKELGRDYVTASSKPKIFSMDDELFEYSRDHSNQYIVEIQGIDIDPKTLSSIYLEGYSFNDGDDVKKDVLTSDKVSIKYEVRADGYEYLTMTIDKDYLLKRSYTIVLNRNGKREEGFSYFIADDPTDYTIKHVPTSRPDETEITERISYLTDSNFGIKQLESESNLSLEMQFYDLVTDVYHVYKERIELPEFANDANNERTVITPVFNLMANDFRGDSLEIVYRNTGEETAEKATYEFYQYDYVNKDWKQLDSFVKDKHIRANIDSLGQFVLVKHRKSFSDISSHWSKGYVEDLASMGGVSGQDCKFNPDQTISNAEFITMIVNNVGLEIVSSDLPYNDVNDEAWYTKFIQTAYNSGLLMEGDYIRPNEPITRLEMAVMISKAYQIDMPVGIMKDDLPFKDLDRLTDDELIHIKINKTLGIINGRSEDIFAPNETATRAEAAVMMIKLLERIPQK